MYQGRIVGLSLNPLTLLIKYSFPTTANYSKYRAKIKIKLFAKTLNFNYY